MNCDWLKCRDLWGHYFYQMKHCKIAHSHFLQDMLLTHHFPAPPSHLPRLCTWKKYRPKRGHGNWEMECSTPAGAGSLAASRWSSERVKQSSLFLEWSLGQSAKRVKECGGGEMIFDKEKQESRIYDKSRSSERETIGNRIILLEKISPNKPKSKSHAIPNVYLI